MLRKIIPIVLIVALVAGAAGAYLFKVNSARFETSETTVVTVTDGSAVYTVKFVDQNGSPVPGVMCNVCDETTCTMLTADEEGIARFADEIYPWKLQLLKAPEGYALPETTEYALDEAGGETTIELIQE